MTESVEAHIWRQAYEQYGDCCLHQMLEEALEAYHRQPGYSDLSRLHRSELGTPGLEILTDTLASSTRRIWYKRHTDHIELRVSLRLHLKRHLQWRLIQDGRGGGAVQDDYFSTDLGL